MDNGGWSERDAIDWTIKGLRESNEELKKENETLEIQNKTLFKIIQENKFEQQNEKLRQDLAFLTKSVKELEEECENNRKIDDLERQLLDFIYKKMKIVKRDNWSSLYLLDIPCIIYNLIFDDTIKDYFISKGVEEKRDDK